MIAEDFLGNLSSASNTRTAAAVENIMKQPPPPLLHHAEAPCPGSCSCPSSGPTWSMTSGREQGFIERLSEASQAFAPPGSTVQQVAEALIGASQRITGAEFAALFLDSDTGFQTVAALGGEQWKGKLEVAMSGEDGVVVATGAIVAEMVTDNPTTTATAKDLDLEALPLRLFHVVPLTGKRSVIGYWVIGDRHSASLGENTVGLVTLLAHHTQIAIVNAIMLERLEHMAITDPLTGLANRRHFHDALDMHLGNAVRDGGQVSLILIDIDHFKSVNDRFGHPVGDYVLKQVAAILSQQTVRGQHLVARYGGEEFAILMDETDQRRGWEVAEGIRHAVAAAAFLTQDTGSQIRCTISLGIAVFPDDVTNKSQLIAHADRALYLAKRAGRNCTMSFPRVGPECFQRHG